MVEGLFEWSGVCRFQALSVRFASLPEFEPANAGVCQWPHANGVRSEATHGVQRGVAGPINSESPPNGGRINGARFSKRIRRLHNDRIAVMGLGCLVSAVPSIWHSHFALRACGCVARPDDG